MTQIASYSQAFPHYRVRQNNQSSQPRYIVSKRLNSVRLNWFMFGAISGITLSFVFNLLFGGLMSLPNGTVRLAQNSPTITVENTKTKDLAGLASVRNVVAETLNEEVKESPKAAEETAKEAVVATVEPAPTDGTVVHKLKSGETLANILVNQSIDYQHAHQAIEALKKRYNPRNLRAGQEISMVLGQDNQGQTVLDELSIATSPIKSVVLTREEETFNVALNEKKLEPQLTLAGGTIVSSLFETGYANGIPDGVLAELMQAYSYDVDFQREIQRGDQVEVLFEKMTTEDGQEAGYGNIIYANLKLRGKPISIYHYEDKDGNGGYFNENGQSVKKALLKTPVNGARISSGFGKRRHPILGYSKMHTGTDFAARTGTPIYASGDGVITYKGRKGGYGNYIQIKHNGTYSSAYAHMSRFGKGMGNGVRVKQGQVIGYVGSTGRSTGPHLHYEVIKNGRKVNPLGEKFKAGQELKGTELANFKASISKIKQQVASMPKAQTTVASR